MLRRRLVRRRDSEQQRLVERPGDEINANGKEAATGPTETRVLPSATRSQTVFVKPAGTVMTGNPC
jgi:hypothetical protein